MSALPPDEGEGMTFPTRIMLTLAVVAVVVLVGLGFVGGLVIPR